MKKSNKSEFVKRSIEKHGNKFYYDKVVYVNSQTKVTLICRNNHEFSVRPDMHLNRGDGCRTCKNNEMVKKNGDFIKELKNKYSDRYDYTLVEYRGIYEKVTLICIKHGQFQKTPNSLLSGHSCPSCTEYNKMNRESFIMKANVVHRDKYIYDEEFEYINSRNKVKILCEKHGYFFQVANNHLRGHGCNKCENRSKSEVIIENYLLSNSINFKIEYKFQDLRYKYPLRFDFVILDESENIKYLLEFNGRQHYEFVRKFHVTEDNFEIYKERDRIKKDYCETMNIKLHIISYKEDIIESLKKIIKDNEENK